MKAKTKRYYERLIKIWIMAHVDEFESDVEYKEVDDVIELSKSHCIAVEGSVYEDGTFCIKWWIQYPQTESKIYYL